MLKTLTVELGQRSYPIEIGVQLVDSVIKKVKARVETGSKVALLTDAHVYESQMSFVEALQDWADGDQLHVLILAPGEQTKSLEQLGKVYDWLADGKVDRTGALFAFGGGVIGDLAGFAAASYLRGIDFYQIPTTLLSMVDSSVGGKTGINLMAGKNLVGAFYQPQAVYADVGLLKTLPIREFSAGMAEVIKYGMLWDQSLFDQLYSLDRLHPEHDALPDVVRRCCEIKAEIVKADERELAKSGGRALLNLGHTFGHGIENAAGYGVYLHGEAIGIGLVMAAKLSQRYYKTLSENDVVKVVELVERYELPTKLREPLAYEEILQAMHRDKKVKQGKMRFIAMDAIGKAVTVDDVSETWIQELWRDVGATF